jgi:multidrug/hemolysin transport system permease protein
MIAFMNRNLKIFFKDKSAVFFSLLAVFIIIGLYALFLGETWTDSF